MATVKTALGEILPNQMGITLSHEHIILTYPSAKSDRPDRYNVETLADQVVEHLGPTVRDYGLKTMIELPHGSSVVMWSCSNWYPNGSTSM